MKIEGFSLVPKSGPSILVSGGIILVLAKEQLIGLLCILLGFILSIYWAQVIRKRGEP